MSFENEIRAEFATMHIMKERGLNGPIGIHLNLGYALEFEDKAKWNLIQKTYEFDIARCLKNGIGDRKGFKYRNLTPTTEEK